MMPKIVSKSHNTHALETIPTKQKQRQTLGEYLCGTGQKPFEGKSENFHNSRESELEELYVPWFVRVLRFL